MNKPWDTLPVVRYPLKRELGPVPVSAQLPAPNGFSSSRIAIIGAGLAGCWLARILAEQGIAVTLYEKHNSVAAAASGNPAGIVKPFVTRSPSAAMSFHCIAHQYLLDRLRLYDLEATAQFTRCGVLQLVEKPYSASDNFINLAALDATRVAGVPLSGHALKFADAGWLNPKQLCSSLVEHSLITRVFGKTITGIKATTPRSPHTLPPLVDTVASIATDNMRRLEFQDGDCAYAEHVVLSTGSARQLVPDATHLPVTAARGQISRFALDSNAVAPKCVINGKHYIIPDGRHLLVGASFHRDNTNSAILEIDHESNWQGLRNLLPDLTVDPKAITGYAGVRATTPDRLPIVGPLPDFNAATIAYGDIRHGRQLADYPSLPCYAGIYLLGGLGSRGITTAPLCAQLLADYLTQTGHQNESSPTFRTNREDTTSALDYGSIASWTSLINPARFLIRSLKRNG